MNYTNAQYGAREEVMGLVESSQEAPIIQAMIDMDKQIERLNKIVERLKSRLDVITIPKIEEPVNDGVRAEARRSNLWGRLDSNARQVNILNSEIENTIDRLDI